MEDREKKAQEMYMQFQMLDQNIKQLQRQFEIIANQLIELSVTSSSLDEFNKIDNGKEVFVPLSSGIFAKANIKDTSELLVNVGANVVVKKNISSTKKLIEDQMEEVKKVQKQMADELNRMINQAAQVEGQLQSLIQEK